MKKTKKIPNTPKYKFGGGFDTKDKQNVKDFAGNYAKYLLDNTANVVGIDAVGAGKGMDYKGTSANKFNQVSNVTGAVAKAAAPMVANALVPGSGQLVSMGQQAAGAAYSQFGPQNEQGFNAYDNQGNPIVNEGDKSAQVGQVVGQVGTMVGGFMGGSPGGGAAVGMSLGGSMGVFAMGGMNMQPNAEGTPINNGNTGVNNPNLSPEMINYILNNMKKDMKYKRTIEDIPMGYKKEVKPLYSQMGFKKTLTNIPVNMDSIPQNTIQQNYQEPKLRFSNGGRMNSEDMIHAPELGGYFRKNGGIQYSNGGTGQINAEVEKEENSLGPNGEFTQFNGNSHSQGGIKTDLPGNSMIFSDRLKLGKKTFAELNKVNNTSKEDKILESNKYGNTSKRTAELMKFAKNKNSEELFNAQEALKQAKVEAYAKKMGVALPQAQKTPEEGMQFAMGGVKLPMYPLGGGTDNTKFTPAQKQQAYTDSMTLYKSGFNKNVPNWQAEPGFNDAVLRLNKLNGTPPQSTDKSAITYDQSYLQKRSVPYAKPVAPEVNYQNKPSTITPNYPMEILPMKKLEYPEMEIKSDFKQVPANKPSTIKTNIVTGPNMSYKEYKQGNEVMDRMYFKPGTEEEIEVTGFKYGGRKLPKYAWGDLTPEQQFLKTKFMGAEQNQRNLAFNKMTGNMNPGYNTQKSAWSPEELQASSDEMISENYPEKASTTPLNQPETYPIRKDKNGKLLFDTPTSNSVGSKRDQELYDAELAKMNASNGRGDSNKFDWKGLAQTGQSLGNFAMQNAGNIYDLTRKQDPLQKYDRATAKFLDPSSAIQDALAQTRRAEYNVRGASGGNAGTYLSNRVALNAQNTENLARIHQNYQNANAQISNQNSQFNTEIAYREAEAQAKDRAMRQNVNSQAIHSMASNFGKASKASKENSMDQKELDMFMYRYKNEPGFKEQVDKFRTA